VFTTTAIHIMISRSDMYVISYLSICRFVLGVQGFDSFRNMRIDVVVYCSQYGGLGYI